MGEVPTLFGVKPYKVKISAEPAKVVKTIKITSTEKHFLTVVQTHRSLPGT